MPGGSAPVADRDIITHDSYAGFRLGMTTDDAFAVDPSMEIDGEEGAYVAATVPIAGIALDGGQTCAG